MKEEERKGSCHSQNQRSLNYERRKLPSAWPQAMQLTPQNIRNLRKVSVEKFKLKLDKYLETLPDEPEIAENIPRTCSQATNSNIDLT